MDNKKKTLMIVLGIFALVIVTTAASFAFFTYSRTGNTKATIISGDIEFSYIEGKSATLTNAFPVADSIGAIDETGEYDFQVKLNSSGVATANYNVYLVDNNTSTNHFTNEQIKFALIKNDVFVANTSATEGVKLSTIPGFNEGTSKGEGIVLEDQEISSGEIDNYKLRIWISDDVSYTNEYLSDGTMEGKYNSYTYSLKVKVTSGIASTIEISNVKVLGDKITADIEDPAGLAAYAVTQSSVAPVNDSDEWIEITGDTAKSNVVRTASSFIASQSISYKVSEIGTYYLYVKNKVNQIKNVKIVIDNIYFPAADYIINLAETNTNELRIDTHAATGQQTFATTEYRYYGKTPNNYVKFNNELWRIIGVFDIDNGSGKIEKRVKLVRHSSIGSYSWDTSVSSVNAGWGVNEWSQADLMTLLNSGPYWNRTSGTCYNGENNKTISCNFTTTGLTNEAKEMIGNAKWYLGAGRPENIYVQNFYNWERGTLTGKQCSTGSYCTDNVKRTTNWIGKVALIYPSDYGYAMNIANCSNQHLGSTACSSTNWLVGKGNVWTLTPYISDSESTSAFIIYGDMVGNNYYRNKDALAVYPTVYLNAEVKIIDGTGTDTNPFILEK